jgi:hypothetical protein
MRIRGHWRSDAGSTCESEYCDSRSSAAVRQAIALSADGNTLAVGAVNESSSATGVNGDQSDNNAQQAGAVYLY